MSIPPLQPDLPPKSESTPAPRGPECMDCGSTLGGKYCHICGQRKQRRVASVISLASEFVSDIFNWDSRLWRTLWPLFAKPGYLTKTYMEGKRERHLPPVRLYLISSIIFFVLISMSPRSFLGELSSTINVKRGDTSSGLEHGLDTEITTESARAVMAILNELGTVNVSSDLLPPTDQDGTDKFNESKPQKSTPDENKLLDAENKPDENKLPDANLDERKVFDLDATIRTDVPTLDNVEGPEQTTASQALTDANVNEIESDTVPASQTTELSDEVNIKDIQIAKVCDGIQELEYNPKFAFLRAPFVRVCRSLSTWRGLVTFVEELIDSLPKTLLVLLPLMAFANKLLYLFARRFYVEHLLYYVHNYSFLFLFTVLLGGIGKLGSLVGLNVGALTFPAGILYVIYYFFKSMRVVYGQGFIFTLLKWFVLVLAFYFLFLLVLLFFMLLTAAVHSL